MIDDFGLMNGVSVIGNRGELRSQSGESLIFMKAPDESLGYFLIQSGGAD